MRTLAYTVVQNDMILLNLWLSYYSRYFDDLVVLCDRTKEKYIPTLEEYKAKYNMKYELNGEPLSEPGPTNEIVKQHQINFLTNHEWVLYCNLDEFIVPDPKKYKDLRDFMRRTRKNYIPCEGFDVIQVHGEEAIDYSQPFLQQRTVWVKNKDMNKILLSKVPLTWNEGQHQIAEVSNEDSRDYRDTGLYLVHLRHADMENPIRDLGPTIRLPHGTITSHQKIDEIMIPDEIRRVF